jgi:tripartite-type tricarboxylate transporter receptor subunit TctC
MKRLIPIVTSIVFFAMGAAEAQNQTFPDHPIRMIVPFEAGGPNDILGRIIAKKAGEYLRQTIVVENRTGAGGALGTDSVARAAPDGYTILFSGTSSLSIVPLLQKAVAYDPIKSFAPVALVGEAPSVLIVAPSMPVKSVPELIAEAKRKPNTYNFGSGGIAATPYLAGEMLKSMSGIDIVHVPYKGAAPALLGLMGNNIQIYFGGITAILPLIASDKVRALAVTGLKRTPLLPDLPTVAETVPGFEVVNWYGALAPAGTPPEVVARLHDAVAEAGKDPEVRKALSDLGIDPISGSPEDMRDYMKRELDKWGRVIKAAGLQPE